MIDYYAALEVSPLASDEEIKKAYRRLVLKYHPDQNQGNTWAVRKMQEINAAYEILGAPEKRKAYDLEHQFDSQEVAPETQSSPTSETDEKDPEAQFKLGIMYYDGEGVTRDYQQAFTWFKRAADQGHADAQALLGMLYYKGEGVPQDYNQAALWLQKAIDQGETSIAHIWLNRLKDRESGTEERKPLWWQNPGCLGLVLAPFIFVYALHDSPLLLAVTVIWWLLVTIRLSKF